MKNLKKPTYDQKRVISANGLNFKDYLVKEDKQDVLVVVEKATDKTVELQK